MTIKIIAMCRSHLSREMFLTHQTWRRPWRRLMMRWTDYLSLACMGTPQDPPQCHQGKGCLGLTNGSAAPVTWSRTSGWREMAGYVQRYCKLTLLLFLPTVVSKIGYVVLFYTSLNILQVISRIFLVEAVSHVESHLQVGCMPFVNMSSWPDAKREMWQQSETEIETFSHEPSEISACLNHLRVVAKAVGRLGDHHLTEGRNNDED